MKTTETAVQNKTGFYQEPTHDEIALAAFLAWERDGRHTGREMQYWLEAEMQLRSSRLKKAETVAAQAALPWPRSTRTVSVKKTAATVAQQLTTAVKRTTTPKAAARAIGKK